MDGNAPYARLVTVVNDYGAIKPGIPFEELMGLVTFGLDKALPPSIEGRGQPMCLLWVDADGTNHILYLDLAHSPEYARSAGSQGKEAIEGRVETFLEEAGCNPDRPHLLIVNPGSGKSEGLRSVEEILASWNCYDGIPEGSRVAEIRRPNAEGRVFPPVVR